MSDVPAITVIVVESDASTIPWGMQRLKPFLVYVAGNPQLRADGATEEEALDRLRKHILSMASGKEVKSVKAVEMRFDELLVADVMGQ